MSPYTPGAGARPPALTGRADLLADAETLLTRVAHFGRPGSAPIVWTGVRGVGKTVTLLEARRLAREQRFLTVHLTADRATGLGGRLAKSVADAVAEADLDRTSRRWARLAERLSTFNVQISVAGVVTVGTAGRGPGGQGVSVGRDQLRQLLEDACDQATDADRPGLLVTIDEVQEALVGDLTALVNTLQDLAGGDRPEVCILAGLPATPERLMAAGSFAERFAYRRLQNLTDDAALQALVAPAQHLRVRWDGDAAAVVLALSRGAPFLVQLYADSIWRAAQPEQGDTIGPVAARSGALAAEQALWDGQYRGRWNRATPTERELLTAVAMCLDDRGVASTADVAKHLRRTTKQLSPARAALIDKGIIESPGRGQLAFTVPGFERFVRAQATEEDDPDGPPRLGGGRPALDG